MGDTDQRDRRSMLAAKPKPETIKVTAKPKPKPETSTVTAKPKPKRKIKGRKTKRSADPVFSTDGRRIAFLTKKEESRVAIVVEESKDLAEVALESYNRKERSDFVLVQPLMCNSVPHDCAYYYHLNFLAKPKDSPTVYLFFAELLWEDELTHCCTLPTDNPSCVGFSNGCGVCDPNNAFRIYHPHAGYKAGSYPYKEGNDYVWSSEDDNQ